jgi:hypothetical protein
VTREVESPKVMGIKQNVESLLWKIGIGREIITDSDLEDDLTLKI